MNTIRKNISIDPSRQPLIKSATQQAGPKAPGPGAPIPQAPSAVKPGHPLADMARVAGGASPATTAPRTEPSKPSKPRSRPDSQAPQSKSAKTAARREAHTGHASVAPAGRENGGRGSGGFRGQGHMDIQDWVPFSAQQSRILRTPRANPSVGSAKVTTHSHHAIRENVFSMARHFYNEVLPSLFRQTPRQAEQNDRQVRKEVLQKEIRHRSERSLARREAILKRAESKTQWVMAGDLTTTFAMS